MSAHERRAWRREPLRLPVLWPDGRRGWTRNVSPEGIYVHVRGAMAPATWSAIEIAFPQARLRFRAISQVLRVEPRGSVTGLAMRLHARRFYAIP